MSEDIHPVDHALGEIHELAILASYNGWSSAGKRLAEAHEAIQAYLIKEPEPKTIEQRLLFVAQELLKLEREISQMDTHDLRWEAMGHIESGDYDIAIAKLTGNWDPTPKEPSYD